MKAISLFSNVGIGEIYLSDIGIDVIAACEIEKKRCEMYKEFYPNVKYVISEDLTLNATKNKIISIFKKEGAELLLATPPCQGMSSAGKGRNWHDERNQLIMDTIEIILNAKPKFVFIENVPSFLNTKLMYNGENKTIKEILNLKLDRYYHIDSKIVDTADYGVPQHRRRTIVLMSRKRYAEKQIIIEKTVEHHTTVREAIGHLPKIEPFISDNKVKINNKEMYVFHKYHYPPFHTSRHISIMKRTPTGKSAFDNIDEFKPRKNDGKIVTGFSTTYKRMTWDEPAPTITMTNGAISSQNNVHPGSLLEDGTYDNPRVLTIFEIMILTSIPSNWSFSSKYSDNFIRSVIGEGIPPLMVKEILMNSIVKDMKENERNKK